MVEVIRDSSGKEVVLDVKGNVIWTIMYSVARGHEGRVRSEDEVIKHKVPWSYRDKNGMLKIQKLLDRGFTFERPKVEGLECTECGLVCKTELGLKSHMRIHK